MPSNGGDVFRELPAASRDTERPPNRRNDLEELELRGVYFPGNRNAGCLLIRETMLRQLMGSPFPELRQVRLDYCFRDRQEQRRPRGRFAPLVLARRCFRLCLIPLRGYLAFRIPPRSGIMRRAALFSPLTPHFRPWIPLTGPTVPTRLHRRAKRRAPLDIVLCRRQSAAPWA